MAKIVQALKPIIQFALALLILGAAGGYERDTLSLETMLLIIGTSLIGLGWIEKRKSNG